MIGLDTNVFVRYVMHDRADLVLQAHRRFAHGDADFVDCLIERIAHAQGCETTMTFDAVAVKAAGMSLVT